MKNERENSTRRSRRFCKEVGERLRQNHRKIIKELAKAKKSKKTYEEDLEKLRQEFPEFDQSWMKVEKIEDEVND